MFVFDHYWFSVSRHLMRWHIQPLYISSIIMPTYRMDGGCYSDGLLVAVPTSLFLLEPLRHNPTLICYFTTSVSYSDVNNVFLILRWEHHFMKSLLTTSNIHILYGYSCNNLVPTAQNDSLGNRPHNRQLPDRISQIMDCNFTIRMLYHNMY